MADPKPKFDPSSLVTLTDKSGRTVSVPTDQKWDYISQGYATPDEAPAPEEPVTLSGIGQGLLARGQAIAQGVGLQGVGDVLSGIVTANTGYTGPRTTERGLEAPLDEQSNFARGVGEAQAERQANVDALGAEKYLWELGGAAAAALATGGASAGGLGAKALASTPAGLVSKLGTGVVAKALGQQATKTALGTAAAYGLGGAAEGALGAATGSAQENISTALADPGQAIKNIAIDTGIGAGLGTVLGGGLGYLSGLGGASKELGDVAETALAPRKVTPNLAPEAAADTILANQSRPLLASQLPEPPRSMSKKFLDGISARRDLGTELAEASHDNRMDLDHLRRLSDEAEVIMDIGRKRAVNDADARNLLRPEVAEAVAPAPAAGMADEAAGAVAPMSGVVDEAAAGAVAPAAQAAPTPALNRLTDVVDPDDVARVNNLTAARDEAKRVVDASTARVQEMQSAADLAAQNAATARQAVDAAEAAKVKGQKLLDLRGQLKKADKASELAQKNLTIAQDALKARGPALDAAEAALQAGGQAPRKLSQLELGARNTIDHVIGQLDEFRHTDVADGKAAVRAMKQLDKHKANIAQMMRDGKYGEAYNLMDQGVKRTIGDFEHATTSPSGKLIAQTLYEKPQQYLELDTWGPLAERQRMVNPKWSESIRTGRDSAFRSLWKQTGEESATGWGNPMGADSAKVDSFTKGIGSPGAESMEEGVRRALRAKLDYLETANRAIGTERSAAIVEEYANTLRRLEGRLDNVVQLKKDAGATTDLNEAIASGAQLAAHALSPGAAFPVAMAGRLMSAVSNRQGMISSALAKGVTKMLQGGGAVLQKATRINPRFALQMLPKTQGGGLRPEDRDQAIQAAKDTIDMTTPHFAKIAQEAAKLEAISPGAGDALIQHKAAEANYLIARLPLAPSSAVFSPRPKLSQDAQRSLDRTIQALYHPRTTFDRILTGQATPEDMDAMRNIYPGVYDQMVNQIMDEVSKPQAKRMPTNVQMYLSRVVGQPLTPALMNIGDAQRRAKAATQGAEDAGKPQGQGANGADGVTPRAPIQLSVDANSVYGSRSDQILASG